jgi:hypothetical protein
MKPKMDNPAPSRKSKSAETPPLTSNGPAASADTNPTAPEITEAKLPSEESSTADVDATNDLSLGSMTNLMESKWGKNPDIASGGINHWGAVELGNNGAAELPPAGHYNAKIADAIGYDKDDVYWLRVSFTLDASSAVPEPEMAPIAATPDSQYFHRVKEGMRLLHRIQKATNIELSGVDIEEIGGLIIGARVQLKLAHKVQDGITDMVIRTILPPRD